MTILAAIVMIASAAQGGIHSFPSESSSVVGSLGFINDEEIGWFWSVGRGDMVSESFADPLVWVDRAIFDFAVPTNVLNNEAQVDWDILINDVTIGSFTINEGFTGSVLLDLSFAPIATDGGLYEVTLLVTNEVPGGYGSHSLAYAGDYSHSVELISVVPAPGAVMLGGIGVGLVGWIRRRRVI